MVYTIDQIRDIVSPIAASYGIPAVWLFGSYARGEATENSDVDLLIDCGDIASGFILGGLYVDLREGLQRELDMVTTQGEDKDFLHRIQRDEVLIYAQ